MQATKTGYVLHHPGMNGDFSIGSDNVWGVLAKALMGALCQVSNRRTHL